MKLLSCGVTLCGLPERVGRRCARSSGEAKYVHALLQSRNLVTTWSSHGVTSDVHPSAVLWTSRRLRSDYRQVKKASLGFWSDTIRYEHRIWSETGYFVLWHQPEADMWNSSGEIYDRCVATPQLWEHWEVPWGVWA